MQQKNRCALFDWGDTVMRDIPGSQVPMYLWQRVEAMPGIIEALTSIRQNWKVALATNSVHSGEDEIRKALSRVGLHNYFDKIYCFRKVGHRKPSPEFFEYVMNDLGIEARNIVMIGDNFEIDILGANQSGIYGIWFNEK